MQLSAKKVKEIKEYGKADTKWWIKHGKEYQQRENVEERYKSVENYYAWLVEQNEARAERLKKQFGYTDETLKERSEIYHEAFWQSYNWWQKQNLKNEVVLAKYAPIFKEAEKIALEVDVSDIKDGFPCGSATLYLKPEAKNTELGKVLRFINDCSSYTAKVCHWSAYKLPIRMPCYGQCIAFDERICKEVAEFLSKMDIPTGVYSYID